MRIVEGIRESDSKLVNIVRKCSRICSAPIGTPIVSFTHNVRFSVKGLTFHTHCWRKLTLPYLAEIQQRPTSPNCPNIEQTCLNLLKRSTNAPPSEQPCKPSENTFYPSSST